MGYLVPDSKVLTRTYVGYNQYAAGNLPQPPFKYGGSGWAGAPATIAVTGTEKRCVSAGGNDYASASTDPGSVPISRDQMLVNGFRLGSWQATQGSTPGIGIWDANAIGLYASVRVIQGAPGSVSWQIGNNGVSALIQDAISQNIFTNTWYFTSLEVFNGSIVVYLQTGGSTVNPAPQYRTENPTALKVYWLPSNTTGYFADAMFAGINMSGVGSWNLHEELIVFVPPTGGGATPGITPSSPPFPFLNSPYSAYKNTRAAMEIYNNVGLQP